MGGEASILQNARPLQDRRCRGKCGNPTVSFRESPNQIENGRVFPELLGGRSARKKQEGELVRVHLGEGLVGLNDHSVLALDGQGRAHRHGPDPCSGPS